MILVIDPTSDPVRLGLAAAGRTVASTEITERRQLSHHLLQEIDTLLSGASLKVAELEAIAVVRGPGPFTSLRISLAVTNALAAATDRPLVGLAPADSWEAVVADATTRLTAGQVERQLRPEYGRPPSISPPTARPEESGWSESAGPRRKS